MKAGTNLEKVLESGAFAVTSEVGPPKGTSAAAIQRKGELLKSCRISQTVLIAISSLISCVKENF